MLDIIAVSFAFIIILITFIAYIQAAVCFGYEGSFTNKMIALAIAFIFGPFYWLYYMIDTGYCRVRLKE
jgi:hypothetical protein|tara:strand:+ start:288 stop:494 length:207 start_codon:yes stop_codon:yes gene_type:complete